MPFGFGETVTLLKLAITGQDDYGNDILTKTPSVIAGCPTWPRSAGNQMFTSEHVQAQDIVIVGLTIVFPPGTDVHFTDQVIVRGDLYEIDGEPGIHTSPLTGFAAGVEIALKRFMG
jgi:hypothetical protein